MIHKAVDFIRDNAPEFGKAKAQRVYLEEFRKTKKALLMQESLKAGVEAANAQERDAYAHIEYKQVLEGLAAAIEIEETLKWQMTAAQMRVDIWRSEQASNRFVDKVHQ